MTHELLYARLKLGYEYGNVPRIRVLFPVFHKVIDTLDLPGVLNSFYPRLNYELVSLNNCLCFPTNFYYLVVFVGRKALAEK
jgi:hypothetical protein